MNDNKASTLIILTLFTGLTCVSASKLQNDNYIHVRPGGDRLQLGPQLGIVRSHIPLHEDTDDDGGNTDSTSARMVIYYANCQERREAVIANKHARAERRLARELIAGNGTSSSAATPLNNDEYAPLCTSDGGYMPLQCHEVIGYCWCVDDAGKPIKGSSSPEHKKPDCVRVRAAHRMRLEAANSMYSFHGSALAPAQDSLLTSTLAPQISQSQRIPTSTSRRELVSDNGSSEEDQPSSNDRDSNTTVASSGDSSKNAFSGDCKETRRRAHEATRNTQNAGIWLPDCDDSQSDGVLFAEIQCHSSRYCWCVDQKTGLPLPGANVVEGTRPDCTEAKANAEVLIAAELSRSQSMNNSGSASNGVCSGERRSNFMRHLINHFQDQLYERLKHNDSLRKELRIDDPQSASKVQVNKWKFTSIDTNSDGIINEREWSRFRSAYKVVQPSHRPKPPSSSSKKLTILRTQRRCWRDFLSSCEFNRTGEDLYISQEQWLECTDTIVKTRANVANTSLSLLAAETRRKGKNPFVPILKGDK